MELNIENLKAEVQKFKDALSEQLRSVHSEINEKGSAVVATLQGHPQNSGRDEIEAGIKEIESSAGKLQDVFAAIRTWTPSFLAEPDPAAQQNTAPENQPPAAEATDNADPQSPANEVPADEASA